MFHILGCVVWLVSPLGNAYFVGFELNCESWWIAYAKSGRMHSIGIPGTNRDLWGSEICHIILTFATILIPFKNVTIWPWSPQPWIGPQFWASRSNEDITFQKYPKRWDGAALDWKAGKQPYPTITRSKFWGSRFCVSFWQTNVDKSSRIDCNKVMHRVSWCKGLRKVSFRWAWMRLDL